METSDTSVEKQLFRGHKVLKSFSATGTCPPLNPSWTSLTNLHYLHYFSNKLQAVAIAEKAASQCPRWSNIKRATKFQLKDMLVQRTHVGFNFINYFAERYSVSRYRRSFVSSFSFQYREDRNNCKTEGRMERFSFQDT